MHSTRETTLTRSATSRSAATGPGMASTINATQIEDVRLAVYHAFRTTCRGPSVLSLEDHTGHAAEIVRAALVSLHVSRDVVLSSAALSAFQADRVRHMSPNAASLAKNAPALNSPHPSVPVDNDLSRDHSIITMAHPFTSTPLGFSVMGRSGLWWGGCSWDAFALAHLLPEQAPLLIATRCRGCDRPIALDVGPTAPPDDTTIVAHFLIPTSRMWDDVVHTCGNQRLFCGEGCVEAWCAREEVDKGYVMDLATLWRLASGWYAGRFERGYRRREPNQAREYFREVGLRGSFWGLE